MSKGSARPRDVVPVKPRHRDAWGAILGQSPNRAKPSGAAALPSWALGTDHVRTWQPAVKSLAFVANSDADLRDFPEVARRRVGYQLHLVQGGQEPSDWRPTVTLAPDCRQIEVQHSGDAYRVTYVASSGNTVYVLHASQKQSQQAGEFDLEINERYEQMSALIQARETGGALMTATRYASVWDALEDGPGTVEDLKIRAALMQDLAARITSSGTTPSYSAEQFGVTQGRISDLMTGRIDVFSIDTLVTMLATAGLHLDLHVHVHVHEAS
ncbi:MAG: type II toxin-antitoxin system RelE/ParE family toxin [Dermatophilaceae bacterium]